MAEVKNMQFARLSDIQLQKLKEVEKEINAAQDLDNPEIYLLACVREQ
ncbi:hypothetical protein [Calderihabitans maritimus]|uniref:Uncharacterized protein n=1 Tax=Calderihabitans maritimus TaxID=1246530 RepID=A0A1Z5HRB3_9FIRM|nr:hypothetical protein [Calderihabitans maritimus]GAW92073.1 hypothetical protein Desku_1137 [Calderihabitans maritimus]